MFKRLIASILILGSQALASTTPLITAVNTEQFDSKQNLLKNSQFEPALGLVFWTASSGTFTTTTTAANVGRGSQSAAWDASATSQTLTSSAITIPAGLFGRNIEASCNFKCASGTCTHTIGFWDGTTLTNTATITSSTSYTRTTINGIAASSGTLAIRITSAQDEPNLFIDDCYLGEARNVSQVSQSQFIGSAYIAATSSCTWDRANSSMGAFSTTSACPGPTVELNPGPGVIQTTDTDLPRFTVNNLPPGNYEVVIAGNMTPVTGGYAVFAINDGTTTSPSLQSNGTTNNGDSVTLNAVFNYTVSGNRTFEVYAAASSNTARINAANTSPNSNLTFRIFRFPGSPEQAYRPDTTPASWSGYHDNTCSWARTNSAFGDFTADASCALVERTNRNFGTVTTTGSVLPGITFTPPRAGRYYVCANVTGFVGGSTGSYRLWDGTTVIEEAGNADTSMTMVPICGIYNVASVASTTLTVQGKNVASSINITQNTSGGNTAIEWSIIELDAPLPAPILVNAVVQPSSGVESLVRLQGTCSSSATVSSNLSGTSIGNISSGACVITLPSNFSATPVCVDASNATSLAALNSFATSATSSTSVTVYGRDVTAGLSTFPYSAVCMGPR